MANMGIYFENQRKQPRWESGQSILHRGSLEHQRRGEQKDEETYTFKNSYGGLRYLKKETEQGLDREGLAIESFEAPGTPVHTEKEKHLDRKTMKKAASKETQALFSSEVPLHNQAVFYDMSAKKRSPEFLQCMKTLIQKQKHQTLMDTFGFLDQEAERLELETLKTMHLEGASPALHKRMDTLNNVLMRKKAKEAQFCSELQLMLTQYEYENKKENEKEPDPDRETQLLEEQTERRKTSPDPEEEKADVDDQSSQPPDQA